MTTPTRISLSVTTTDQDVITRAGETLARTAIGLALDGVDTFLMAGPDTDTEDDTP